LEDEVDTLTSSCRFLSQVQENDNILRLERNQIETTRLLGEGAFSEVYSVTMSTTTTTNENDDVVKDESNSDESESNSGSDCNTPNNNNNNNNTPNNLVMKHLRSDLLSDRKKFTQAAADLVLETRFLARLDHPNIIKLHGYAKDGVAQAFGDGRHDGYFVLLEKVELTLADKIRQWKLLLRRNEKKLSQQQQELQWQEQIRYATQLASALEYLHERNIIYRDLKPDNIGIAADGNIRLLDLGLCRELPESQDIANNNDVFSMSGVGTRRYMAPEVALGKGYNLKADVYGLAMVLYELFSLQKPFEMYNRDMHKQFACLDGVRPTLSSSWPEGLRDVIVRAWDGDAKMRPTMADLCRQLQELAAESSASGGGGGKGMVFRRKKGLFRAVAVRLFKRNTKNNNGKHNGNSGSNNKNNNNNNNNNKKAMIPNLSSRTCESSNVSV